MRTTQFFAWSIFGAALHLALLVLPLCMLGTLGWAAYDIPCCLFLGLATIFCLGDLSTMKFGMGKSGAGFDSHVSSPTDECAWQLARASSLWILLIFWVALAQHATSWTEILPDQMIVGTLLMLSGVVLRWLAIHKLGAHFVTEVTVRRQQPLVQSGVYRWVRHPSETGLLAVVLGATVLLSSPRAALLWCVGLIPMTLVRLRHEERSLADGFGPRFEEYARRVKGLIPFVI